MNVFNQPIEDVRRTNDGKYIQGASHTCHVLNHKERNRIIIKTAFSEERLLDEVTLFLHRVKKKYALGNHIHSRTNEDCELNLMGYTLLIVDDDLTNIYVLASTLKECGAKVIEAISGKVALEECRNQKIDLVLMDIMTAIS